MKTLRQKHEEFIARLKANGIKILTFTAPCCGSAIEDRAAGKGETWDTLATCPYCGTLYLKVTTDHDIVGSIKAKAA